MIITLTLMAFVLLLLLGLLTFSNVETTTSSNQIQTNQARENARFALNIALSELQRTAGDDRRITAQARLIDEVFLNPSNPFNPQSDYTPTTNSNLRGHFEHPFWTGVVDPSAAGSLDQTTDWHWLVSGNENIQDSDDQGQSPEGPGTYPNSYLPDNTISRDSNFEPDSNWIRLVGPGSAKRPDLEHIYDENWVADPWVYVPAQDIYSDVPGIPNQQQRTGRYAYWVGDEGVKANLALGGYRELVHENESDLVKERRSRQTQAIHLMNSLRTGVEFFSDRLDRDPYVWDSDWEEVNPLDDRWQNVRMVRQAALFDHIDWKDEVRAAFHGVTAHSYGVLANPDPNAPPNRAGLKRDLTRNPDHTDLLPEIANALPHFVEFGRWMETEYFVPDLTYKEDYNASATTNTPVPTVDPALASAGPPNGNGTSHYRYPLRYLEVGQTGMGPYDNIPLVVANFRIRGVVRPDSPTGGENTTFEILLFPELEIWNPYTADITLFDGSQTGYDLVMRVTYKQGANGVPFLLRPAAGIHWKFSSPTEPAPPVTDHYVSWLPDQGTNAGGLGFFGIQGNTDSAGDEYLEFRFDDPNEPHIRLRAGDSYLLTGHPLILGPQVPSGNGSNEDQRPTSMTFSPRDPAVHPQGQWTIQQAKGTLYVDVLNVGDLEPIEFAVYAVPDGQSVSDDEYVIFRREILPEDMDFIPNPVANGVVDVGPYPDVTAWSNDWDNANPYASNNALDWNAGDDAPFVLGFRLDGTGAELNNLAQDPRDPGVGRVYPFYWDDPYTTSPLPNLMNFAWGSESGLPYSEDRFGETLFAGLQPTSLSDWYRRGIVLFDLPNDLSADFYQPAGDPTRKPGVVTSIGQLQHLYLEGNRPFLVGDEASDAQPFNDALWDSFYFSGLYATANSNDSNDFQNLTDIEFMNPRMTIVGRDDPDILAHLEEATTFDRAAQNLLVRGTFNINSTSVEAWALLLHNELQENLSFIYSPDTAVDFDDDVYFGRFEYRERVVASQSGSKNNGPAFLGVPYPRFSFNPGLTLYGRQPYTETGGDGIGNMRSIWRNGYRELYPLDLESPLDRSGNPKPPIYVTPTNPLKHLDPDPTEFTTPYIDGRGLIAEEMARLIVAKIRDYVDSTGRPFVTVADFVNEGILQEAIDEVGWIDPSPAPYEPGETYPPEPPSSTTKYGLNWFFNPVSLAWEQIPSTSPSYLTQQDILARIGPYLATRSDTFVIRAYGETRNPVTDEIEAVAYCEAVVQRTPQPWNPATSPNPLAPTNRKFEIVSFRWLDPGEI